MIPVTVAREDDLPDEIDVAGYGWRIEYQRHDRPNFWRQLVDDPGKQKAGNIAERACNYGKKQRVFERDQKYVIVQEKPGIVLPADKSRQLQHIEVKKAEPK